MKCRTIIDAIGNTPLVELSGMSPKRSVRIFAKLEGMNPTGSVKDRIVRYMLEDAEKRGDLTPDKTIMEPSSGNTGIALSMIGRRKGYRVKLIVPDNVTSEVKHLIKLYGAEVVYSDASQGANGAIALSKVLVKEGNYHMLYQYGNPANPLAHYETTGGEILRDLPHVDVFVAGLGTSGTLMGVSRRLKEKNPATRVIAVTPHPGEEVRGLRSLEDGFIPPVLDMSYLDGRMVVRSKAAFLATKELTAKEGIFAGISSGAVLYCAIRIAQRMKKGNIVILLADGGWKYVSSGLWTKDFTEVEKEIEDKVWW